MRLQELLKLKDPIRILSHTKDRLSAVIPAAAYQSVILEVAAGGGVNLTSSYLRDYQLEAMKATVELEVRKQGAYAAQAALIAGLTATVTAQRGRIISNKRTRVDGRQLVLAV